MRSPRRPARILLDLGQVLSGPMDPSVFHPLLAELGISEAAFLETWALRRRDYDEGILDGPSYWRQTLASCGVGDAGAFVEARLAELHETDIAAWMSPRPAVHALLEGFLDSGVELAILSNMPRGIGSRFVAAWPLIGRIALRFFSGDEGFAKPDPAFYLHFLERSGWSADHTLFIDDTARNIEAATALGFAVHHFIEEKAALKALRSWAN
ncbi:MAG: HAD-IA family hydrolase [Spirochaetota bacterium]